MKKGTIVLLSTLSIMMPFSTGTVYAYSSNSLREVVVDGLYGALAGALIGTATLAFVDQPSDHTKNIQIGAGVGVILGSIYGTLKISRSFAELKEGKITVQFPTIQPDPYAAKQNGALAWNLSLFQITY